MSETISITVTIGDRMYPLKVRVGEEESVREAEHLINQKFNEFQLRFSGQEKLDYLAMSALMNVVELMRNYQESASVTENLKMKLSEASQLISENLRKS